MRVLRAVGFALSLAAAVGSGVAAFSTRDRWTPHVFPRKAAKPAEAPDAKDAPPTDRVKLSAQAQKNLGLEVGPPVARDYWRTVLIPGVVVDRPGESDRGVTTKVAGVVLDIQARPGDTVRPGDPLVTLQLVSEYLQAAQTDLARAAREREFAAVKRDRTAELVRQGTQAGAVLIEDENQVKRLDGQVNGYRRQLRVFGLTAEQVDRAETGDVVTEVTITAPAHAHDAEHGGLFEVQELKVALGAQVQAGQTLCLLANHSRLFVEGRAFKAEAATLAAVARDRVPVGAEFADDVPGEWPEQPPLTIHHLSNQIDPSDRTFGFYLAVDNTPRTFVRDGRTHFVWRYRPGQRVRLRVPVERVVALGPDGKTEVKPFVLPAAAVVREGAEAFAFVKSGDEFVRRPVRVLHESRDDVVVANDGSLSATDAVVRAGASAINRAIQAAAAGGGGHGHSHEH